MTIDERAAACSDDILFRLRGQTPAEIIARHIREAVAERDALLADVYKHAGNGSPKRHALPPYLRDAIREVLFPGSQARIDTMIGEQA